MTKAERQQVVQRFEANLKFWTFDSSNRPFSQCLMSELHVFKYVCPNHDVKPGCLITDSWDSYKKHVERHIRNNELETSWQVPSCETQHQKWTVQMERCRAVNVLTQEVTQRRPDENRDLPQFRKVLHPSVRMLNQLFVPATQYILMCCCNACRVQGAGWQPHFSLISSMTQPMPSMPPSTSVSRCASAGTLAMVTVGTISWVTIIHIGTSSGLCCSCLASSSDVWPLCLAGWHQGQHCSSRHRARRCFCTLHDNSR